MDREYVDLLYWKNGGDSFACQLYNLIGKADKFNKEKLRKGFPEYLAAWEEWFNSPNEEEFLDDLKERIRVK